MEVGSPLLKTPQPVGVPQPARRERQGQTVIMMKVSPAPLLDPLEKFLELLELDSSSSSNLGRCRR